VSPEGVVGCGAVVNVHGLTVSDAAVDELTKEAVIVAVLLVVTTEVAIAKLAAVDPAGTTTVDGTNAIDGELLASETVAPPVGAGPINVTVPVELLPPIRLVGFTARLLTPFTIFRLADAVPL
jgi:hypothetical protein